MDLEGWEILPDNYGFLEIHDVSQPQHELLTLPVDDHHGVESPVVFDQAEQEVSQVFFKKMKEAEFAGTAKMESPRSNSSSKSFVPKMDVGEAYRREAMEGAKNDQMNGRVNIWRWNLNGIGAICTFGVAAAAAVATLCIIFIGNSQKHKHQNHKLCFQICADDKRINKAVHPATKLDEAN